MRRLMMLVIVVCSLAAMLVAGARYAFALANQRTKATGLVTLPGK